MNEEQAIDAIEEQCRGDDFVENGIILDNILHQFLCDNDYGRLAEALRSTAAWREELTK